MWGYRLFIDKKKLRYQRVNIIKAKNNFLYENTKEKKKYFDFTSTIHGGIFGYNHKFTTSKLKLALSKFNHYLHSAKQINSFLNPLYHHYPIFKEYYLYSLSNNQLWQWLANDYRHQVSQESIEKNNYFPLTFWEEHTRENQQQPLIHWQTDLKLFYQNYETIAKATAATSKSIQVNSETNNSLKGLLLNSFFPHALHYFFKPSQKKQKMEKENYHILEILKNNFKQQEDFDFILYAGQIPCSANSQILLWSKQEQNSLKTIAATESTTPSLLL